MEDTSDHGGGAKDLLSLLKRKPALLIAGIVGVVILVLILMKKNGDTSGAIAPTGTTSTSTGTGGSPDLGTVTIAVQPSYSGSNMPLHLHPSTNATSATMPATNPVASPTTPTSPTIGTATPIPSANSNPTVGATGNVAPQAYLGLLGPNVKVNFTSRTYSENGKNIPLPASVGKLVQGDQNRVWYIDPQGKQDLLTSGYGAGVFNSGYAPNTKGVNS